MYGTLDVLVLSMLEWGITSCRYGIVLLVVECMGATTVLIYGLHLLYDPVMEDLEEDPNCPGKPLVWHFWSACVHLTPPTCPKFVQLLTAMLFDPLPYTIAHKHTLPVRVGYDKRHLWRMPKMRGMADDSRMHAWLCVP